MSVFKSHVTLMGSKLEGENTLPYLREVEDDFPVNLSNKIPEELKLDFGKDSAYRVLPYKIQDKYSRNKKEMKLETIILENDILKATFIPSFGGRLYSLFNKELDRESLSVNPVLQPANLGTRNAWISGGIEWNVGHFGHSCLTSDHVHFGVCKNDDGEEFLRLYEFERMKKIFYQIDFHLPKGSKELITYTRIFNIYDAPTRLYYWSNIAVSEMNDARVFSKADEVVFTNASVSAESDSYTDFSYGDLPYLGDLEVDGSYPRNFVNSLEYFYQTKKDVVHPWEAVTYNDGFMFYEYSSRPLNYRKMFCWGTRAGGAKWQDYLANEQSESYVEIQAGVYPTQLHNGELKEHSEVSFMQVFGGKFVEKEECYKAFKLSRNYVEESIFMNTQEKQLKDLEQSLVYLSNKTIDNVISKGRSWGTLEIERLKLEKVDFPIDSMNFETTSLGSEQKYWKKVLLHEETDSSFSDEHISYMIDPAWEIHLLKMIESSNNTQYHIVQLAVIYSENKRIEDAISLMEKHINKSTSLLYLYVFAELCNKSKKYNDAECYYDLAYARIESCSNESMKEDFIVKFLQFLNARKLYMNAWSVYLKLESMGINLTEAMVLELAQIAFELKKWDFVKRSFNIQPEKIREGNNVLVDLWFKMKAIEVDKDYTYVKKNYNPPSNIDFRMV